MVNSTFQNVWTNPELRQAAENGATFTCRYWAIGRIASYGDGWTDRSGCCRRINGTCRPAEQAHIEIMLHQLKSRLWKNKKNSGNMIYIKMIFDRWHSILRETAERKTVFASYYLRICKWNATFRGSENWLWLEICHFAKKLSIGGLLKTLKSEDVLYRKSVVYLPCDDRGDG